MASETRELWEKTDDKYGLRPKEPLYCPLCACRKPPIESQLVMRRSYIHSVPDIRVTFAEKGSTVRPYAADMAFKCPRCDFFIVCGVPLEMEYAQKVIALRDGKENFILPVDEWDENAEIKSRLKALGYW